MAIAIADLKQSKPDKPARTLIYGVPKIGKTTLATEFPAPVFLQVEEGTPADAEINGWTIETWEQVVEAMLALISEEHSFQTVVLDSVSALQPLIWNKVCRENKWTSIEQPGYGKGYVEADTLWRKLLEGMNALRRERGMNIVLIAHAEVERFNDPVTEPYDRYSIRLHKRAAPILIDDMDVIAFINYMASVQKVDEGFGKKVSVAKGAGQRMIYLEERPAFLAGNRFNMPESLPYNKGKGFAVLSDYLPGAKAPAAKQTKKAA